jgi:predicted ATPase/DNA-binding XRE family transcriptional regulator
VSVNDASATFGEMLRDYRRAAELTQEELAERAGVSPRSISELERGGAHTPRRDTVAMLARALGLRGKNLEAFEGRIERRRRPAGMPHVAQRGAALNNLPRALTSFVGREQELEELGPLLDATPLLTLVGAGGVGKSRLAHELIRRHLGEYDEGCWIVELAGLSDPALLPGAVAAAVGLRDFQAVNTTDALTEYLRQRRVLLILDNCEHLVSACADLVAHLLRFCIELKVLATSREPLAISGESTWRVLPLQLPETIDPSSLRNITPTAAMDLFVARAQAVNHTLALSEENAPAIARICVAVDGIPLALELAAARTRLLTVEQLADRLERDADVLSGPNRAGLPQHRTMRATIDWSHDLLDGAEQALLRRLSVFAGGWTLKLAEEVCGGAGVEQAHVLPILAQLVDKSMVLVESRDQEARYRLLQPIRQYATERLEASAEVEMYRGRHSEAVLRLALAVQAGSPGVDEIASLDRVEAEHDNLRAALRWALSHGQGASALRCSAALFRFWERRGHFQEGCAWVEEALAGVGDAPTPERSWALNSLAFLYSRGGDTDRALPIAQEALAVSRAAGSSRDVAQALLNLGMIAYFNDETELAIERLEESASVGREAAYEPQLSLVLTFLARARLRGRGPHDQRGLAALRESLRLSQAAQSRYTTGHALSTLGNYAWRQGDSHRAMTLWRQSLMVRAELAERRGIAGCLERLALALAAHDAFASAAWLFGAADAQHRVLGTRLRHEQEKDHLRLVAATRRNLGDAFLTAWMDGQAATADEAVTRALEDTRHLFDDGAPQEIASETASLAWSTT